MQQHRGMEGNKLVAYRLLTLAFASTAALAACGPPATVTGPSSGLSTTVNIIDITETPSDGKVIAVMQFSQGGKTVQIGDATMTCNGVALTYNGLLFGYAERVPLVATGGTYRFRHTRSGVNSDVNVTVPPRPVFAAPTTAGATLARSASFTIHYVADGGTAVRGDASDPSHSKNDSQADDGTHDGLDTSGFTPGPGTLSLTRTLQAAVAGTPFSSATSKFDTGKTIAITWQ
ncbi:MAG: hypothetical protein E6J91_37130 [Deltaproteobacteria bacterium]|nr:MAG: hypothetical protein E6J91_37130 [Deltaproteobacteria bacterium]